MNKSPATVAEAPSFELWRSSFASFVLPFRIAQRFALFLMATALMTLGVASLKGLQTLRIISVKSFRHYTSLLIRYTCQALCRVCRLKIENQQSLLSLTKTIPRSLILCNHVSYLDIIVIGALVPGRFLSKKEVANWPLIGWCGKWTQMIFVDRFDLHDRVRALFQLKKACLTEHAIVFPEGTTTANLTPDLNRWQRGNVWAAHRNRIPMIGVGIQYQRQEQIAWIDDQTFFPHLMKVFAMPSISVKISAKLVETKSQNLRAQSRIAYESVVKRCHEIANSNP